MVKERAQDGAQALEIELFQFLQLFQLELRFVQSLIRLVELLL